MLLDRTLKSLLEEPSIADIAPDAISNWGLSEKDFYDWTLGEIADKMGWRFLERGFTRLFKAAASGNYYYKLYSEEERENDPEKERPSLVWFPSDDAAADDKPYILLVPGGGFESVWNMNEGWPVASHFNDLGYHAFVLTYRVGTEGAALLAMEDMARAFR